MSNNTAILEKVAPMYREFEDRREYFYPGLQAGRVEDNVAVIIDGANLSQISRAFFGKSVDYNKLNLMLRENYPGLRTIEFVITEYLTKDNPHDPNGRKFTKGYSSMRALLRYLETNRYKVNSRSVLVDDTITGFHNDMNPEHQMDVEITCALYKAARYAKHIVFFGSSAKYATPLADLKEQGHTITVIGVKKPDPRDRDRAINLKAKYVAEELRKIDNFVDLADPFFDCILKPMKISIRKSDETTDREETALSLENTNNS